MRPSLAGKVAVVTGATRGCGRAIAVELGRHGATVYATGRTTRASASPMKRAETIEDTAQLIDAAGGRGIAVRCDYTFTATTFTVASTRSSGATKRRACPSGSIHV